MIEPEWRPDGDWINLVLMGSMLIIVCLVTLLADHEAARRVMPGSPVYDDLRRERRW